MPPAADDLFGENWNIQQDNCLVHCSNYTNDWFDANDVDVLYWPPKTSDLNIVENFWCQLGRAIYTDGKQYETTRELDATVAELSIFYVKACYRLIPKRLIEVVERKWCIVIYRRCRGANCYTNTHNFGCLKLVCLVSLGLRYFERDLVRVLCSQHSHIWFV